MVTVTNPETFQATHDDGASLAINGTTIFSSPGPTSARISSGTYTGPSGTFAFDLVYGECCGLPATLGISLPLTTQIVSLPGTPDPNNLNQLLFDLTQTGCTDCNAMQEGGQTGTTCNNGPVSGTISKVTVTGGQSCRFTNCTITGGLTINGGSAYLQNCQVNGGLTEIAGLLSIAGGSVVNGGVQDFLGEYLQYRSQRAD